MNGLALLLLATVASAYGAWASLKSRPPLLAAAVAAILFAAAGVIAVLAMWIAGDGVVLPGRQLSPGLVAYWLSESGADLFSTGRWLVLVAPLAHLLLLLVRRDRAALVRPLPATALFVWLFLGAGEAAATRTTVVQAKGPEQVAYLTIGSREGKTRLVLAVGDPFDAFLRVVHAHDTESVPPELHLHWTRDGKGLVIRVHEESDPSFAVDVDGKVTGELPVAAREWPADYVPGDVRQRFSFARKEVSKFIRAHGGLAPP